MIFLSEFALLVEQNSIYILCQTLALLEIVHIIRYPSKDHITLDDIISRHLDIFAFIKIFALAKSERRKLDLISHSVVQTAMTVYQFIQYP